MVKKKDISKKLDYIWASLRLSLGVIFLWAFFEKLFGLGFTTCKDRMTGDVEVMCDSAWLNGGSPTTGFLENATTGPFADLFQNLANNAFVDWLFMLGLLGIGLSLVLGIAVKLGSASGILMMVLMWLAVLPPEHHPFMDDHIVYAIVLVGVMCANGTQKLGFAKQWKSMSFVKKMPILE